MSSGDRSRLIRFAESLKIELSARQTAVYAIEIGGKPILWHIMKSYAAHGVDEFIVCLGYKGYMIKEYFANYFLHMSDVTLELGTNTRTVHNAKAESWKVTLVDTGEESMTGGRLMQVGKYLDAGQSFCMTYGDGLASQRFAATLAGTS